MNPRALRWRDALHLLLMVFALRASPAASVPTSDLATPWRVLVLLGGDPGQIAIQQQDQAFRNALLAAAPHGVDFFTEPLDTVRFRYVDQESEFLALQRRKYATQRVDLVVGLGGQTIDFVNRYHDELWPAARVLLYSISEEVARRTGMPAGASLVPWRHDIEGTLSLVKALQPQVRRLIVIGGATESDRGLSAQVARLAQAQPQWKIETWSDLSIAQLRVRVAALDRNDAIVFTSMSRDATGQAMFPADALQRFANASVAPIYGLYTSYLGRGVVAGQMADFEGNGRRAGEVAAALLSGQAKASTEQPIPTKCVADYALLVAHGLSPSALPAGCELRNAPRNIWQDYGVYVAAALAVLVLQALTIGGLLVQRQRRRKAEAEAAERRLELGRATRFAAMGELTASIAHEINQPLGAILANADAAAMMVRSGTASQAQLGEMLADIRREDLRAGEVIRRLRALLEKRAVTHLPFRLHPVLDDALGLLAPEARRRGVVIERSFEARDDQLLGDAVQFQQVLLNLTLNAMDAMQQEVPARRRLTIRTVDGDASVELQVADRGCGISDVQRDKVFDSFVTTKPNGMGLGLSIVRAIVEVHGGRIGFTSRDGGGTLFTVIFPRRLGVVPQAFDSPAAAVPM
jgi:signal transduction histidine kinase